MNCNRRLSDLDAAEGRTPRGVQQRWVRAMLALTLVAAAACAGRSSSPAEAGTSLTTKRCSLAPEDSARLLELSAALGVRVYERCEVDRSARRLSAFFRRPPDERPTSTQPCLEAALEFVVGADGRVFPAPILATATNSPRFAREMLGRHKEWRFSAATRDGVKVAQLVRDTAYYAFVPSVNGKPVATTDRPRCNRY